MKARTTGLRETWKRALREHGARLVFLVSLLNGDGYAQRQEHWKRLTPAVKGIDWRLPDWPNVFPAYSVLEQDPRTLLELRTDTRRHLQIFMDSWFSAGRNSAKWQDENPDLATALNEAGQCIRLSFHFTAEGGVRPATRVETPVEKRTLYGAASMFGDFLLNPFGDVVAGRCKRCKRYFFNRKGYEQMVYCSQKCRWAAHNTEKEISREQAQQKQQSTALSAMRKLLSILEGSTATKVSRLSWKDAVVSEVNKKHRTQLEAKWLTRAINNPKGRYHKQLVRLQDAIEKQLEQASAGK